jgi:hypothetical protein
MQPGSGTPGLRRNTRSVSGLSIFVLAANVHTCEPAAGSGMGRDARCRARLDAHGAHVEAPRDAGCRGRCDRHAAFQGRHVRLPSACASGARPLRGRLPRRWPRGAMRTHTPRSPPCRATAAHSWSRSHATRSPMAGDHPAAPRPGAGVPRCAAGHAWRDRSDEAALRDALAPVDLDGDLPLARATRAELRMGRVALARRMGRFDAPGMPHVGMTDDLSGTKCATFRVVRASIGMCRRGTPSPVHRHVHPDDRRLPRGGHPRPAPFAALR